MIDSTELRVLADLHEENGDDFSEKLRYAADRMDEFEEEHKKVAWLANVSSIAICFSTLFAITKRAARLPEFAWDDESDENPPFAYSGTDIVEETLEFMARFDVEVDGEDRYEREVQKLHERYLSIFHWCVARDATLGDCEPYEALHRIGVRLLDSHMYKSSAVANLYEVLMNQHILVDLDNVTERLLKELWKRSPKTEGSVTWSR